MNAVQGEEPLGPPLESTSSMLEAEEALRLVRERFEHTQDPEAQGELAAEALGHVERQLKLTRERRRALDGVEGVHALVDGRFAALRRRCRDRRPRRGVVPAPHPLEGHGPAAGVAGVQASVVAIAPRE